MKFGILNFVEKDAYNSSWPGINLAAQNKHYFLNRIETVMQQVFCNFEHNISEKK